MDLTQDERAVLKQIRDFFGEASITSYRFNSLASRWPESHRDAYQAAFDSLVAKRLLLRDGEHMFGITHAGLKAMV